MKTKLLVLALMCLVRGEPACEDLNTAACALFLASKPDLCQDQSLSANCKRFCGQCPLVCYDCPTAVSSPDDCNMTKTCAQGELPPFGNDCRDVLSVFCMPPYFYGSGIVCMKKVHTNPDGSKEFIMSCEAKSTCEGLSFGFHSIIGKRNDDNDAVHHDRRDLSFQCCDVDRCNYPTEFMTTTTFPPTTNVPTTTLPTTTLMPLNNCSRDIVFVLDGSTSIGAYNHIYLRQFVQRVISGLTIGIMDSLVAVVEYSNTARVEWYLTDHTSQRDLQNAASHIPYVQGSTGTHAALYLVHNSVLTARHGDRANAKDVVVILTDGGTDIPALAFSEAQKLHDDGVTVIAIGVGKNTDSNELLQYANHGHAYSVSSFQLLPYTANTLLKNLCE